MLEGNLVAAQAAVELNDVCKTYERDGQHIPVLEHIALFIPQGEFMALMGPSGSGKTTLLNLIAGIDRPTSGSVLVHGTEGTAVSEGALAKCRGRNGGFIFPFSTLIPVLTAAGNVELPLMLSPLSKKQRRERTLPALRIVGLADRAEYNPRQLSGA